MACYCFLLLLLLVVNANAYFMPESSDEWNAKLSPDELVRKLSPGELIRKLYPRKTSECDRGDIQECTCFELLQVEKYHKMGQRVDVTDVVKGYRAGSKFHHPDRKGGSHDAFLFLTKCHGKLSNNGTLADYQEQVGRLQAKRERKGWDEEKFRFAVDEFNDGFFLHEASRTKETHTPQHLFLDESGSMGGWFSSGNLPIAHNALQSIQDRIQRTPTAVHFIGTNSYQKFHFEDDVSTDDIVQVWGSGGGGTKLWQYIFGVLQGERRSEGSKKDEAVIITDGLDGLSSGDFLGLEGYNHMMTELNRLGVKMRISVLCIGNESHCKSPHYRDLAVATGGVYANVDPGAGDHDRSLQLLPFTEHVVASNAERERREIDNRREYELKLARGEVLTLPWYESLESEGLGSNEEQGPSSASDSSGTGHFQTFEL